MPVDSKPVTQEARVHKPVPTSLPAQAQPVHIPSQQPAFTAVHSQSQPQPAFLQSKYLSNQNQT